MADVIFIKRSGTREIPEASYQALATLITTIQTDLITLEGLLTLGGNQAAYDAIQEKVDQLKAATVN